MARAALAGRAAVACEAPPADELGVFVMTPRHRRMMLVGLIVLGVGSAVAFALTAFQDNLLYFYSPSDVAAGKAPADRVFRVGGMVPEGSFNRPAGSLEAHFELT